jgi:hypothetical protein
MTCLVAHPMDDLPLQMVPFGQLISGQPRRKTISGHQIQFLCKAWHEKLHTYDMKIQGYNMKRTVQNSKAKWQ